MQMDKIIKLEQYANLDGTEIGDYVYALLDVARFSQSHGMTDQFFNAVQAELHHWLTRFETETEIVTSKIPQPDAIVTELVWLDE